MSSKSRAPLPSTAFTLPARYYTDTQLFERELDVFYRRMWVCVGRLEEVPIRGAYLTREIAGESIIVVRTSDADIRALFNVCRHRGTRLCADSSGRFSGAIQCPYHAWTYDYDGRLVGAPHMDGSPDFRKEDFPLHAASVDVWDGHVFVHLGEGAISLETQLADLPANFARGTWGISSAPDESSTTSPPTGN
jgi:Rieske 2Fe-2S family protein